MKFFPNFFWCFFKYIVFGSKNKYIFQNILIFKKKIIVKQMCMMLRNTVLFLIIIFLHCAPHKKEKKLSVDINVIVQWKFFTEKFIELLLLKSLGLRQVIENENIFSVSVILYSLSSHSVWNKRENYTIINCIHCKKIIKFGDTRTKLLFVSRVKSRDWLLSARLDHQSSLMWRSNKSSKNPGWRHPRLSVRIIPVGLLKFDKGMKILV